MEIYLTLAAVLPAKRMKIEELASEMPKIILIVTLGCTLYNSRKLRKALLATHGEPRA